MSNSEFFKYCQDGFENEGNPLYAWYALLLSDGNIPEWVFEYLSNAAKGILEIQFQEFNQNNKDIESARYIKKCLKITNNHIKKIENKNRNKKLFFDIIDISIKNECSNSQAIDIYWKSSDRPPLEREYIERIFFNEQKKAGGKKVVTNFKNAKRNMNQS